MDDEMLGIDIGACDGCALCVAACPEGAILPDHAPEIRRGSDGDEFGFAACEGTPTPDVPGRMPCVHAVSLEALLQLYVRGVRTIWVARGDCGTCVRGGAERLDTRVTGLSRLLHGRGLAPMRLVSVRSEQWQALHRTTEDATRPATTRRGFLRVAMGRAVEQVSHQVLPGAALEPGLESATPPGHVLPRTREDQPAFFAPVIDPLACNGCDACMRLCPHGALAVADGGDAYLIDADACTGCGICVDVCDQDASSVAAWAVPSVSRLALASGRCAGCGAGFRWPVARGTIGALCRICEVTANHRQLFQVMD